MSCLRVILMWWIVTVDLPQLESIQCGRGSVAFYLSGEGSSLVLKSIRKEMRWCEDLPKLTTITTSSNGGNETFEHPHHITLESMIELTLLSHRHSLSHQYRPHQPFHPQGGFDSNESTKWSLFTYRHFCRSITVYCLISFRQCCFPYQTTPSQYNAL